jgi:hypothetical protein
MRQQDPDHHEIGHVLEMLLPVWKLVLNLPRSPRNCEYSEAASSEVLQESVGTIWHTVPPTTKHTYPDWQTQIILAIAELSLAHAESLRRLHPAETGTAKLSLNSYPQRWRPPGHKLPGSRVPESKQDTINIETLKRLSVFLSSSVRKFCASVRI